MSINDIKHRFKMEYFKRKEEFKGSISLSSTSISIEEKVTSKARAILSGEETSTEFSNVLDSLNEKYNTSFTNADKVILDDLKNRILKNPDVVAKARVNDKENFIEHIFKDIFNTTVADCFDEEQKIHSTLDSSYQKLFEDAGYNNSIANIIGQMIYEEVNKNKDE